MLIERRGRQGAEGTVVVPRGRKRARCGCPRLPNRTGKVVVRSYSDGETACDFGGHASAIRSILVHPKGSWVVTGDADGLVCFWNPEDGAELARIERADRGNGLVDLLLLDRGERVVAATRQSLIAWDVRAIEAKAP